MKFSNSNLCFESRSGIDIGKHISHTFLPVGFKTVANRTVWLPCIRRGVAVGAMCLKAVGGADSSSVAKLLRLPLPVALSS
jgi:hypothetical protein